ncbi:metal-sulfur cluster assembly factor [Uliginosibacterium sp. H3]|uniref:Metal-sulfur cluster assembly factor n=1 Tax=Uliginosibacterium silvisoli TaxID=3114758 RepID=A0ABU6K7L5_9RHOO|nr:metal-sulfur cluster assembly factor [Uliginosibacterium sp. H3]
MNRPHVACDAEKLQQALRQIIDPEVGLNIVDLGLVYRLETSSEGVQLDMTMTSPACPMSGGILAEVEEVLAANLPADACIEVQLVWNPPWSPDLMSDTAREHFGW